MSHCIHDRLLQVTLDDTTGCVEQAGTPADREAEKDHPRTTAKLRRQRGEIATAITQTECEPEDIIKELNLCLASLQQGARDTDGAIQTPDAQLASLLHDPFPAASQPRATALLAACAAPTSAASQSLTVTLSAALTISAVSKPPVANPFANRPALTLAALQTLAPHLR